MRNLILSLILIFLTSLLVLQEYNFEDIQTLVQKESSYWLILYRRSNIEFLYFGEPGNKNNSQLVKIFKVSSGVLDEKPTPLPKLLGKDYWLITDEVESNDPETSPYFLTLDIPVTDEEPYGPKPYLECEGQCNWVLPGSFGLHGVNGDESRLLSGSSGCVRHSDKDITYLYNILDPKEGVRYYIEDI